MNKQQQYANSIAGAIEELDMLKMQVQDFSDERISEKEFRSAFTDFVNALDSLLNSSR